MPFLLGTATQARGASCNRHRWCQALEIQQWTDTVMSSLELTSEQDNSDCMQRTCSSTIVGVHLQTDCTALQCITLHVPHMITSRNEVTFDGAL